MNIKLPSVVDFRALTADLAGYPNLSRLRSLTKKAATAQSCAADLAQAQNCVDALREVQGKITDAAAMSIQAVEYSLLYMAVILYERGTSAAAKRGERGSVNIAARLTDEQRQDHDALVKLRQRALAHVYSGEEIDGNIWHRNVLFAISNAGGWRLGHTTRRVHFHRPTFDRLERQVPVAAGLLVEKFQDRLSAVTDALTETPVPEELWLKHRVDPVDLFGSGGVAAQIMLGAQGGSSRLSFMG